MDKTSNIVDITEYARAKRASHSTSSSLHVVTTTPLSIAGTMILIASMFSFTYMSFLVAQVGTVDLLVLAIFTVDLLTAGLGIGLILAAPRLRRHLTQDILADEEAQESAVIGTGEMEPPVSFTKAQARRSAGTVAMMRCQSCATMFEPDPLDATCPSCGKAQRTA